MAKNNKNQNLLNEFPELTQSTVNDVMGSVNNNADKASEVLRAFVEEERRHKEIKIKELQDQFTLLPRQLIVQVLEETKYDVEAAIVPLFNKVDEIQSELKKKEQVETKKKRDHEEKRRREEELKLQTKNLMEVFRTIPKDTIQHILDENEGDIQETTNQLLQIVSDQEETKRFENEKKQKEREDHARKLRQEQEDRMRNLKIEALKEKFAELSLDEVVSTLEHTKWDIKEACKALMSLVAERKKNELKGLFQSFRDEQLQEVLEENDWNMVATVKSLANLREQRKVEEKKKKQESATVIITKVQQSLLERSILMGKELEAEVTKEHEQRKKAQEEEAKEMFRKELGNIITHQAQNNAMPGLMPPPLPKQIDQLLGKKKPVEDDQENEPVKPAEIKASPVSVSREQSGQIKGLNVTLSTVPTVVDCGNPISVEWEVLSGVSSASDWIGFFPADQPNKQYLTYEWRGKQEKKGTLTFTAPSTYGVYEFRYFPSSSYEHVALSNRVTVGPQVTVNATLDKDSKKIKVIWTQKSGNQYRRAWMGLFEKSVANNKQFVSWEYAGNPNTEISFVAPVKPAAYEVRFFSYGYVDVARSNSIMIEGADRISAGIQDKTITIKLNIVTVDPITDVVWIGLFFVDQQDNKQWRRYKYVTDRTADVTFKAPQTAGTYEARLFANKTYDCVIKSNTFVIPAKQ